MIVRVSYINDDTQCQFISSLMSKGLAAKRKTLCQALPIYLLFLVSGSILKGCVFPLPERHGPSARAVLQIFQTFFGTRALGTMIWARVEIGDFTYNGHPKIHRAKVKESESFPI